MDKQKKASNYSLKDRYIYAEKMLGDTLDEPTKFFTEGKTLSTREAYQEIKGGSLIGMGLIDQYLDDLEDDPEDSKRELSEKQKYGRLNQWKLFFRGLIRELEYKMQPAKRLDIKTGDEVLMKFNGGECIGTVIGFLYDKANIRHPYKNGEKVTDIPINIFRLHSSGTEDETNVKWEIVTF